MEIKVRSRTSIIFLIMISMVFLLFLSACSNGSTTKVELPKSTDKEPATTKEFPNEPVTLKLAVPWNEDILKKQIGDFLKETHPHITLELVHWDGKSESMQEMNAKQIVPDLIMGSLGPEALEELDMIYPLDDMVKEYQIDLSKINQEAVNGVRSRDPQGKGRLIGLPESINTYGVYYNKEIFDKFGVEYPKDGMTWDEIYELSKQMTTSIDGVDYVGFQFGDGSIYFANSPLRQLTSSMTDPETGEVLITKDPNFTKFLELLKKFYSIPGFYNKDRQGDPFSDKTAAMKLTWTGEFNNFGGGSIDEKIDYQKDFDIITVPSWSDLPNTGISSYSHFWSINNYSENKEAALQVLSFIISEETQRKRARIGIGPLYNDTETLDSYLAENPLYDGKNKASFLKHKNAPVPERASKWDKYVTFDYAKFVQSDMNIHEFLRTTAEDAANKIKDAMAKDSSEAK